MKSFALSLLVAALIPQATAPQAGVVLRRTLKADATDTYAIVDHADLMLKSPLGDMPSTITTTRTFILKTKTPDDKAGTVPIEATTTVEKVEADGAASDLVKAKPAPAIQNGKIDVRGRMTFDKKAAGEIAGNLLSGASSTLAAGSFVEFSEKAVKVGDAWDITIPKDPLVYGEDQKLRATLTAEREVDGVAVWVVSIRGIVRSDVDSSKVPGLKPFSTPIGPMTIHMVGTDDINGEGLVEKATGRTISMITKTVSKKTIEMVEAGISMNATGTLDSKITLKKAAE